MKIFFLYLKHTGNVCVHLIFEQQRPRQANISIHRIMVAGGSVQISVGFMEYFS